MSDQVQESLLASEEAVIEKVDMPTAVEAGKRRIKNALKLQTLVFKRRRGSGPRMENGGQIAKEFEHLAELDREVFVAVTLNQKHQVIGSYIVSMGTLTASLVHPRECFRAAIYDGAASIVFVHNHPSGDPAPSRQDRMLHERLDEVAKLLGITLLDNIIVGEPGRYYSFEANGECSRMFGGGRSQI